MVNVAAIVGYLEEQAPPRLAEDWDNVGLLLGDSQAGVERIMTCLTVTPETAMEALESTAQLIVTHHPVMFRSVKRLTAETPDGRLLLNLIRGGVAVYSLHTAFDNAPGGINDLLAGRFDLVDVAPLRQRAGPPPYKLVVFVPESDLARVMDALFAAGAGQIGQYSQCSFRLAGTGTFFGSEAARPAVGQKGRREEVAEWRLEVVCPEANISPVIAALRRAHSYEEPAYDIYPLQPPPSFQGAGRVGRLPSALSLAELARRAKDVLQAPGVQVVGDPGRQVKRVALACGAGGDLLQDAIRAGVDVFLTGELRFHDHLSAQAHGLALLLPGHFATERLGVEELASKLQQRWPGLTVWPSRRERDPVAWIGC